MGGSSDIALKCLQWFVRGVQFCCAGLILAIYSYFIATTRSHNVGVENWIRAVEGISGLAVVYSVLGLLLLCCLAGRPATSAIAIFLDFCFAIAFIYVAVANRGGAGSCRGQVYTPLGSGDAGNSTPLGSSDPTSAPTLRQICQLETASMSVAIIAIFFFIVSAGVEYALLRHRRKELHIGPSPANDYTFGSGRPGFFSRFQRRRVPLEPILANPNALPSHALPSEVNNPYAAGATHLNGNTSDLAYNKYGESGFNQYPGNPAADYHTNAPAAADITHNPSGNYRYEDGVYNAQ